MVGQQLQSMQSLMNALDEVLSSIHSAAIHTVELDMLWRSGASGIYTGMYTNRLRDAEREPEYQLVTMQRIHDNIAQSRFDSLQYATVRFTLPDMTAFHLVGHRSFRGVSFVDRIRLILGPWSRRGILAVYYKVSAEDQEDSS